ncbi:MULTISPECIES: hypothetical protein [Corynebacterium]|jgi:hypothetical protein|uniref:hypothetical protein n=1 Tax=Corynebacterium TaxID=1716 RepID=UPI001EDC18B9|nr:hypothetical protein [Corynebacterium accolens]MDK4330287.1 hypothetical protein [Corynebacterium accolens]MDK4333726.1 hypothetical protein [Corynebacterium accolens]MDK8682297.1 hypothetical protein [Corynebacterium accolens]
MKTEWSSSAFGGYMNSLLKRYFAEENVISPEAVELRAAWRTSRFVYCVFSVKSTRGIAYLGMELPPIPSTGGVSSEEDTAAKGWADKLAGEYFAGDLDYDSGDKIEWLGKASNNVPQHFMELTRMKADKKEDSELYIPLTNHG